MFAIINRHVWFVAAFAALSQGCISNESPIRLLNNRVMKSGIPTGGCELLDMARSSGSLDLDRSRSYVAAFMYENDLQQISTSSGGDELADDSRNNFFVKERVFNYSSQPSLVLPEEIVPGHFVMAPGAAGDDAYILINLMSAGVANTLYNALTPGGSSITLFVSLQLRGQLASGQKLNSNTIVYPIDVYRSGFTPCAAGDFAVPGPCGNPGQDGALAACCSQVPDNDACK